MQGESSFLPGKLSISELLRVEGGDIEILL